VLFGEWIDQIVKHMAIEASPHCAKQCVDLQVACWESSKGNSVMRLLMLDRKPVLLCIDDNGRALSIRKLVLESAGYAVLTAESTDIALQLFTESTVDLVLSDYLLPGKTGTQLAAEMKKVKPEVPIVIFSGVTEIPEGIGNADIFLSKTEPPAEVLATVAKLLEKRQ